MKENNRTEKYQIIILGRNCFPRVVLTEYGLIKTKYQGRKTMPFDLAGHSIGTIVKYLENDFSDYFDGITINTETKEIKNQLTDAVFLMIKIALILINSKKDLVIV